MGSSRVLKYSIAPHDGQEVRFVEDAPGGLKTTGTVKGGGSGTIRYATGEAKGSRRTVTAQVLQDELPRAAITVARYTAPNPTVGRPGSVRVRRSGSRAIITWKAAPLAASYLVAVTNSEGGRSSFYPAKGARRVTVPGVGSNERLSVSVVAVSAAGRRGPAGRPPTAPKKRRGRK